MALKLYPFSLRQTNLQNQETSAFNEVPVITPAAATSPNPTLAPTLNIQHDSHIWSIIDPEISRENPVEDKHRRLVRSHRSGPLDRELKPNSHDRDALSVRRRYTHTQNYFIANG